MAVLVTSQPVDSPAGLRFTVGKVDFNGTTYSVGGLAVTATQWGGGVGSIPNRLPDFVLFQAGTASDDGDTDFACIFGYTASTGKVLIYGEESTTAELGALEADAEAATATAKFLAIWVNAGVAVVQ